MMEKTVKITLENKSTNTEKISFATPTLKAGLSWKLPLSFSLKPNEKRIVTIAVNVDSDKVTEGIHFGHVKIESRGSNEIGLPYLFVVGDAEHPRVMGFSFEKENEADADDVYKYELYLPEGAEELGIALFNPLTLTYVGHLVHERNVKRGLLEAELKRGDIPFADGDYICIVYAIQNGKEGVQEGRITIGDEKEE
jgi:minor extracellular serine protease Vpr